MALRGSIAMFTGDSSTPWHLTIGNPNAPIISMSRVYVKNIEISHTGEMLYNDIPKFINVSITVDQSRNLGKNEIANIFGIKYNRVYSSVADLKPDPPINNPTITPVSKDQLDIEKKGLTTSDDNSSSTSEEDNSNTNPDAKKSNNF